MHKKWLVLAGIFLFLIPSVIAVQPSQSYNQLFLSPFVLPAMTNNQNYSFLVNVNPPDGLSSVKSAIINFDVYMTPSVNFTIRVNGSLCNTQFFYVSTTYASAGQGRIKFDCSNVINELGTYNITLRPSGANTGSANGWLDLTYMNNPKIENLFVSGTEYNLGDYATIFLQLKDAQGTPINNGNCYLDVYYPSYGNFSHPVLYNDVGMLYKTASNGLYFFDMVVPNVTGVYMLGASCAYAFQLNWLYDPSETVKKPTRTAMNGTYLSDTLVLNSYEDGLYEKCTSILFGGDRVCEAYYDFNSTGLDNFTSLDLYYAGESNEAPTATFYVWNWTSSAWVTLPNTLTFSSTASASSPPAPTSIDEFVTNPITPSNYTINYTTKMTRIRMRIVLGTTYNLYNNWLALKFLTSEGQIQELKGSGELHVSNALSNLTVKINTTDLNSILSAIASVNQTLNTTILNYLVTINGTTFNINGTQYNSLLSAINSVNATANLTLSYVTALNGSVFNLSIAELSHFNQLLAFLRDINYTLNTTLEYKLDLINGTVMQINESQTAYYLSLLGAINSLGATLNGTIIPYLVGISGNLTEITQYLVVINGTTYQINQSQFTYYTNLLQAINSVNNTQNWQYLNLLSLLNDINATGNATLTLVASINQSLLTYYTNLYNSLISLNTTQNQHFADIMDFLASLNYTLNTTLELKLDMINDTVFNIQDTVNQINYTVSNLNFTINFSEVIAAISQVNSTVNQNQQYLIAINDTLWNDIFVILKDINFTTNTTLEYKLDLINYTTWQSWVMLQNLTIGNVTVLASVNWTEGVPIIWNASGQSQINYSLLSLSNEGIQLVVETLTCVGNTTLVHTLNVTNCVMGQCLDSVKNITESCAYGCANSMCVPAPTIQYFSILGVVLLIAGFTYVIWRAGGKG